MSLPRQRTTTGHKEWRSMLFMTATIFQGCQHHFHPTPRLALPVYFLSSFMSQSLICYEFKQVVCVWNVMAHAQKADFVFRRKGRVHLNCQGASVQSTTGSRGVRISGSNAGYTMFRGSVKSTGYPIHSPVSPSLLLPCVTVCHHISTGLYCK